MPELQPEQIIDQLRRITRSPEFASIPDRDKADSVAAFLRANNQEFAGLSEFSQMQVAIDLMREASPGLIERIGSVLPLTGRAIQAFRGEEVPGAIGLIAERAPTTGVIGGFEGLPGIELEGGVSREEAIAARRRALAESPAWSRAALALVGEVAELGVIFPIASAGTSAMMGRMLARPSIMAAEALAKGSESVARQAATQAFRASLTKRLGTDVLAGEMFGVLDAMERGEIRPLEQFIINPLAIAGLGATLFGVHRAWRRFGPLRTEQGQRFLDANPDMAIPVREAQQLVNAVSRATRTSREEAGELVFKVATGQGSPEEMFIIRDVLKSNPEHLGEEFGLHLLRMLKPVLRTNIRVADVSPTITFEDVRTRREQTVKLRSVDVPEAQALADRVRSGEIRILHAEGPEQIVGRFRPEGPIVEAPPPVVMQGTEALPTAMEVAMQRAGMQPREVRPRQTIPPGTEFTDEGVRAHLGMSVPEALASGLVERTDRGMFLFRGGGGPPTIETPPPGAAPAGVVPPPGVPPPAGAIPTAADVAAQRAGLQPRPVEPSPIVGPAGQPVFARPPVGVRLADPLPLEDVPFAARLVEGNRRYPIIRDNRQVGFADMSREGDVLSLNFIKSREPLTPGELRALMRDASARPEFQGITTIEGVRVTGARGLLVGEAAAQPRRVSRVRVDIPDAPGLSPVESMERSMMMPTARDIAELRAKRLFEAEPPRVARMRPADAQEIAFDMGYAEVPAPNQAMAMRNVERLMDVELQMRGVKTEGMTREQKVTAMEIVPDEPFPGPEGIAVPVITDITAAGQPVKGADARVVSISDPRGVVIQTEGRTVITPPLADGQVMLPRPVLTGPAGPPVRDVPLELITKMRNEPEVVVIRPTRTGEVERRMITSPTAQNDTITVTDQITGQSFTVTMDHMVDLLRAGQISQWRPALAMSSTAELIGDAQRINSTLWSMRTADPAKFREMNSRLSAVVTELQRRTGRLGDPIPSGEKKMSRMLKVLAEQRGSIRFGMEPGEPIPQRLTLLPADSLVQMEAGMVGGRALSAPDGRIVLEVPIEGRPLRVVYESEVVADAALRDLMAQQMERARLTEIAERAAQTRRLDIPQAEPPPQAYDPVLAVDKALHGDNPASINSPAYFGDGRDFPIEKLWLPVESKLIRLGKPGRDLRDLLVRTRDAWEQMTGRDLVELDRILSRLDDRVLAPAREGEKSLFFRVIEDGAPDPGGVRQAYNEIMQILNRQYETGRLLLPDIAPFEPNYMPHRFEWAKIEEVGSRHRDQFIRALMEQRGIERGEAESLAAFIIENRKKARISGALEKDRLGIPGYITDVRRSFSATISMNNRRLAEAQVLGPDYEVAKDAISRVRAQFGAYAGEYAQSAFDLETGLRRTRLHSTTRSLLMWQAAKLSLSVLANSQQPLNVLMKTNLSSFMRALGYVAKQPRVAAREAQSVGAVVHGLLGEIRGEGLAMPIEEAVGFFGRGKRAVERMSTALFNLVEIYSNRSIASKAGQFYFDQQAALLKRNPTDAKVIARLREIGFSKDAVLRASEGELNVMRDLAGKRTSDATQFRGTPLKMPLFASDHELGRFAFQFKTFAVNQARFVAHELFGPHGDLQRRLRAMAVLFAVYPASGIAITRMRRFLMGGTIASDAVERAFDDPSIQNWLVAGAYALTMSGALGITADLAATAVSGNQFAMRSFFIPPGAATVENMITVAGSAVRGVANQDSHEFERAARTASREFGGLGLAFTRGLGKALGLRVLAGEGRTPESEEISFPGGFSVR